MQSAELPQQRAGHALEHDPVWVCPKTGLSVPKRSVENLRFRKELLKKADEDPGFRAAMVAACSESMLFWINAFAWTYRQKDIDPKTGRERPAKVSHVPFITWPVQDNAFTLIHDSIRNGGDVAIDKSRDMGASWIGLTVFDWFFLFVEEANFLMFSRKEDLVDSSGKKSPYTARGSKKTLFWKLDYLHSRMPRWMCPDLVRTYLHLENPRMNTTIDGESTTSDAGQGDRRWAALLDEFARVPNGSDMLVATADVTSCRVLNSTPNGAGTAHHEAVTSGRMEVIVLGWWDHPEKGKGRKVITDSLTGAKKWTSPWYENECKRRTPREVAENLDIKHVGSGHSFFDSDIAYRHISMHGAPPLISGDLRSWDGGDWDDLDKRLKQRDINSFVFVDGADRSRWNLWCELIDGRPPQNTSYVLTCDPGNGQGQSNTVISVGDVDTRKKVAEFASPDFPPHIAARIMVAAALWFGGAFDPLLVWEANGPGALFGQEVVRLGYSRVYYQRQQGTRSEAKTARMGWGSTRTNKEILLGQYRSALDRNEIENPSIPAVKETLEYLIFDDGSIGPGKMRDESTGARASHGDRVIADALLVPGFRDAFTGKPTPRVIPVGSEAWYRARRKEAERLRKRSEWA